MYQQIINQATVKQNLPVTLINPTVQKTVSTVVVKQTDINATNDSDIIDSFNTHALISKMHIIPDLTSVATPTKKGPIWHKNLFMGIDYSDAEIPCQPFIFSGRQVGELYSPIVDGFDNDIEHIQTAFYISRRDIRVEPEPDLCCPCPCEGVEEECRPEKVTKYFGNFLNVHQCPCDDRSKDVPFLHYRAEICDIKKFKANKTDVAKFVLLSSYNDSESGLQLTFSDRAVLKNNKYNDECPEKFELKPKSVLSSFVTISPKLIISAVYSISVNVNINEINDRVSIKGNNVYSDEISMKLKSAEDTVNGKTSEAENAIDNLPSSINFTFSSKDKCENEYTDKTVSFDATYIIPTNHISQNFIDALSDANGDNTFKSIEKFFDIYISENDNNFKFKTILFDSEYQYDENSPETEDNTINIYMEIQY